tara:strand:+ start:15774 stop:16844 length:1071 start_codon:yes stop_codon:yes gene_type:complete
MGILGDKLPGPLAAGTPLSALAPMQDVTTLPFMQVVDQLGSPDYFFTEYFRVHVHSTLEKYILDSITENPSGRPVFAQLIGENLEYMERTVKELIKYPVAGIDLNMGCPAPKVYKNNVGGGLLRDVNKVDSLLGHLRDYIPGLFTVKMRVGFEDWANYDALLALINKHQVDLLSMHGRTVKEMYRSEVHYDLIKHAVESVNCPVFANGNITSAKKAEWTLNYTGAAGVMIGRSAIRNPWIFRQVREHFLGQELFQPKLSDVFGYIQTLYDRVACPGDSETRRTARMKKFVNFVGLGVEPEGKFLKQMRRTVTKADFFEVCERFCLGENADKLFAPEPYENLIARPSCEKPLKACSL